jgi:hypothetical protein
MYRSLTTMLSLLLVALGAVILVRTLLDGFGVGVLLGLLFVAAGVGRILMSRRRV